MDELQSTYRLKMGEMADGYERGMEELRREVEGVRRVAMEREVRGWSSSSSEGNLNRIPFKTAKSEFTAKTHNLKYPQANIHSPPG